MYIFNRDFEEILHIRKVSYLILRLFAAKKINRNFLRSILFADIRFNFPL